MSKIPALVDALLNPENLLGTPEPWYLSESEWKVRRYLGGFPGFCWYQHIQKSPTLKPLLRVQVSLADAPRYEEREDG